MTVRELIKELNKIPEEKRDLIEIMFDATPDNSELFLLKSIDIAELASIPEDSNNEKEIFLLECGFNLDNNFNKN